LAIDKRSRNRLIIVTLVLAVVIGFLLYQSSIGSYSYYKTVSELKNDPSLIGVAVRVGGIVVKDSLERDSSGYHFLISDKAGTIKINYDGVMPQTFGEGIQVVAEGTYQSNSQLDANKIITKCPTKYQSKQKAK
jgi:cytochrome c-type biogenesis protein CcmE